LRKKTEDGKMRRWEGGKKPVVEGVRVKVGD